MNVFQLFVFVVFELVCLLLYVCFVMVIVHCLVVLSSSWLSCIPDCDCHCPCSCVCYCVL